MSGLAVIEPLGVLLVIALPPEHDGKDVTGLGARSRGEIDRCHDCRADRCFRFERRERVAAGRAIDEMDVVADGSARAQRR